MSKKMKKISVFALALLMLALCALPALANTYNELAGSTTGADSNGLFSITEQMALEKPDTAKPIVSYTFTVKEGNVSPTYGADAGYQGSPVVTNTTNQVDYNRDTVYSDGDGSDYSRKSAPATVTFNFGNVKFLKPGVYYWKVEKKAFFTDGVNAGAISNNNLGASTITASATQHVTEFYVYAIVTNAGDASANDGTSNLQVTYGCYENADVGSSAAKDADILDKYPAKATDLTLKKLVEGQLGDKTKPFPFTITITSTDNSQSGSYSLEYYKDGVKQTGVINNSAASIALSNGTGTASVSLAHDESVKIVGLPEGVGYTIQETGVSNGKTSEDYNVTAVVEGDTEGVTNNAASVGANNDGTVSDTKLQSETTVTYTNNKTTTPPTGILLNGGPGIAVILIALAGLAVLMVTRRRRKEDSAQ